MWEQRIVLEHHRRAASRGRQIGDVAVADQDVAVGHGFVPGDHAQRAGLAAAARAQQAAIAGARDAERDRVDREGLVVALGDRGQLDIEARFHSRSVGRALSDKADHDGMAPARRRCRRRIRHSVRPMTRNDTPVVMVPIANRVGEVALEISA